MTDLGPQHSATAVPVHTVEEFRAAVRFDLRTFIDRSFALLHPSTTLSWNWHLDAIVDKLEACRRGEIRRLIISVPPRSLKSHCVSVCFPAFVLGHNPSAQIICVSYADHFAGKLARETRDVMQAGWYRRTFGEVLASANPAAHELVTKGKGFRFATSIGGVLTGRGADYLIIDDPLKPEEAASEVQRERVNEWYGGTLLSRLNDKRRGCIIVIMQRLHEYDLIGHLLGIEDWEVLSFPAIAERDESFSINTIVDAYTHHRAVGDVLHPDREPRETLEALRHSIGDFNFAAQYQQSPRPRGGGMVKEQWFETYTVATKPAAFQRVLQSWDTASKATEFADYSVCTTWGITPDETFYLLDVFREKLEYPDLKRAVRRLNDQWHPQTVLIEDKASGIQLIQELRREGMHSVTPYKPRVEKVMRLQAQTPKIEQRRLYLPEHASWRAVYVYEMTSFPMGRYDDQVDSTAQALEWVEDNSGPVRWFAAMEALERAREKAGLHQYSGPGYEFG